MAGRGSRAVGRRLRRVARSTWGFTGALLTVVLGLGVVVHGLYDHADAHRQSQALASELETDAVELQVAEDALMTDGNSVEVRAEVTDELADLHVKLRALRGVSDEAIVSAIERDLRTLESALRTQLAHVRSGDQEAAEEVDELRTDPAFADFDARTEAAYDDYATAAERIAEVGGIALWLALLAAGMVIGGLSWRHERGRRASQDAVEQRLRERVAEIAEITERHRQIEALKHSFVSSVSHELRTPLTAIHGSLEMLEDGDAGPLPPTAARVVSIAARGTRRLTRLVDDIVDFELLKSNRFVLHPAQRDLHALLLNTVESMTPLAEHAGVDLVLQETHADVLCDGDRVIQALVNLVGNAIKFSSPGCSIHLGAVRRGDEVEVSVRDEGRGIPLEQLGAVFDRFHQVDTEADQAKGGVGLGLTITRHIVEAHGGRIWAESQHGDGTTFRFTLPLALPEPHDPEAATPPSEGQVIR